MPAGRCVAFGRRIATDIALPGAIPDDDRQAPEILIRHAVPHMTDDDSGPTLRRDGATLHFNPHRVAEYRCAADTIHVSPCPGAAEDEIAALLIATALPGLLWLQGAVMLHAAAAILPGHDRAIAIAARSGTGKSAMLAQLVARGARVVAEDSLCLRAGAGGLEASGLPGGYFEHHPDPAARRFVALDAGRTVDRAMLGTILIMSRDAAEAPAALRRLAAFDALAAILSHRHRPAIPALFGDTGQRLADAARIARMPVHAWRRRTGSIDLTTAEWQAIDRLGDGGDND